MGALNKIIDELDWADSIAIGCGIGNNDDTQVIVNQIIKESEVPVVLDADALNIIAEDTSVLLLAHTELVITPHLGEMSRLTGDSIAFIQTRLIDTADKFAGKFHVTCVLKDEHTVVATPHGRTYLNLSGNHGMATAGSGDVLTGIIGSLLTQRADTETAAALGVYLHGLSGDTALKKCGFRGMMAGDIVNGLRDFLAENQL